MLSLRVFTAIASQIMGVLLIPNFSPLCLSGNLLPGNLLPGNLLPGNRLPGNGLPGNLLPGNLPGNLNQKSSSRISARNKIEGTPILKLAMVDR